MYDKQTPLSPGGIEFNLTYESFKTMQADVILTTYMASFSTY